MKPRIDTAHLFTPLDQKLIELLEQLKTGDWNKPTVAGNWRVKDVVAHLLDGNIRALSMQRDRYVGESTPEIDGYQGLVDWLNKLNSDWVLAMKRISPAVLITLHKTTGPLTSSYFASLDPFEEAIFAVDWAGESQSYNWMHLAREYTEKWHHQQQIRDAVGIESIMTEQFFLSFIQTYMMGLPNTFKNVEAKTGTTIKVEVTTSLGGTWFITRNNEAWQFADSPVSEPSAIVSLSPHVAWKLFSKNTRPNEVVEQVGMEGELRLARQVLEMVSVMA